MAEMVEDGRHQSRLNLGHGGTHVLNLQHKKHLLMKGFPLKTLHFHTFSSYVQLLRCFSGRPQEGAHEGLAVSDLAGEPSTFTCQVHMGQEDLPQDIHIIYVYLYVYMRSIS